MKWLLPFAFILLTTGCKKKVDQTTEDALIYLITNGQWKVSKYTQGSADVTAEFNGYLFQFKKDESVDALVNGSVVKTGTWIGNATNKTITSGFTNATLPLTRLNGVWTIKRSGLTYVESEQQINGELAFLRLDKQ